MKWFNFSYLRKKPWLIFGLLVFGVIVFMMINRKVDAGSSVVTSGKSDAQIAAEAQLGMAQIQASIAQGNTAAQLAAIQAQGDIALALAQLDAGYKVQQLGVQREIAAAGIAAQIHAMDIAYQQSVNNNAFQLDYATLAFDASLGMAELNAKVAQTGMLMSAIGSLKSKDRDDTLERIFGNPSVMQYSNPGTGSSGGFNFGNLISPVGSMFL